MEWVRMALGLLSPIFTFNMSTEHCPSQNASACPNSTHHLTFLTSLNSKLLYTCSEGFNDYELGVYASGGQMLTVGAVQHFSPYLGVSSHWNLLAGLSGQWVHTINLVSAAGMGLETRRHSLLFRGVLGTQIQVFMLVQQALYLLNDFPSPWTTILNMKRLPPFNKHSLVLREMLIMPVVLPWKNTHE